MAALKPCPFCGSKKFWSYNAMGPGWPDDTVKCKDCKGEAPIKVWDIRPNTVEFCRWTWDDEKWSTGCGEAFCFIDGGPSENGMKYCTYCGKRLIEAEERSRRCT